MIRYELTNETGYKIKDSLIKKILRVFDSTTKLKAAEISLVLVKPATIRKWNRLYRGKDKVTDVLSFAEAEAEFVEDSRNLGEILICLSRAKQQARAYGWDLDYEFSRLLVHGLAHLIGYEHEGVSKAVCQQMQEFEDRVLLLIIDN